MEQKTPPESRTTRSNLQKKQGTVSPGPAGTPLLSFTRNEVHQHRAAEADPEVLRIKQTLRDYRAALGENPVGTNAEITRALLGANARKAQFVDPGTRLNSSQQLVDRWNHPYFFHQLSRTHMEIRSAGPDGVMWTADDEVSR